LVGDKAAWSADPFAGELRDGQLFGPAPPI
jgi:acetylornithine deacetylase/succinyl-diaminopimelate desuccinylase-like protein